MEFEGEMRTISTPDRVETSIGKLSGSYLILPPGFDGDAPDGYHVYRSRTYGVWTFMRGSVADGLEASVANITENLKVYPLAQRHDPPSMEFISGSGKAFNTVHPNDFTFYEHVAELVDAESDEMLDVETRGLLASIGIEKGRPFAPDDRMKRLGPEAPAGRERNWLQTIPGKSWFAALRMYGPEQAWIDKTWRPSEITPEASPATTIPDEAEVGG